MVASSDMHFVTFPNSEMCRLVLWPGLESIMTPCYSLLIDKSEYIYNFFNQKNLKVNTV